MRILSLALAIALALVASPVLAAPGEPPASATAAGGQAVEARHWIGPDAATISHDVQAGAEGTLWIALRPNAPIGNATRLLVHVNASPNATLNVTPVVLDVDPSSGGWDLTPLTFVAPSDVGPRPYALDVAVTADGNASFHEAFTIEGEWTVVADAPIAPPPTGLSPLLLVGIGLAVLAGGAGLIATHRRRERARMNSGPRRSQALREVELERQAVKRPQEVEAVQQEIRQQEVVREKRRELQILEAKRADVLKSIDLLKKRHETGALSKLQLDNMVAKKQADLVRIEAEIAAMEREDGGAAA